LRYKPSFENGAGPVPTYFFMLSAHFTREPQYASYGCKGE
jgi:hypothetical protein